MVAPTAPTASFGQVVPQVEGAIRDWDQGGRATILDLLKPATRSASTTLLATLPCHLTLRIVFQAQALSVKQITDVLTEATKKDPDLLETILDVTEIIEQELEDTKDLVQGNNEATTDSVPRSPSKALQVVKALLQSKVMPSHLPSLLLSLSHFPYLGLLNPGYPVLALQRLHTRRYTNAVIRQLKHNLLRESSEGFSALIIVLTDAEGKSPTSMWTHCEAVMGFFNLSPTRVLDVALDVFASSVEIQWRFWLDFFKCTPWGREAAWTGGKGKGRATEDVAQLNTEAIEPFVLKEKGNRLLAEVLGFKFAEYQREECEIATPMGLIYVAALLIKEGFVKSLDLLPFLTPDEKQLATIATKYTDDIRAKAGSGASNALANAAALTEEPDMPVGAAGASTPTTTAAVATPVAPAEPKEVPEQRIQLLQAFLGLGYVSGAYFILASSPTLAQSHPAVSDHLLRLMAVAIEPVYQASVRDVQDVDDDWGFTAPKRSFIPPATKRLTPTHILPLPPATPLEEFEFFYPSWLDDIETWSTPGDLWVKGSKLFKLVAGMGSRDIVLATKVCRIAAACFARYRKEKEQALGLPSVERVGVVATNLDAPLPAFSARSLETEKQLVPTEKEMAPWLFMLRAFLLPSMTLSDSNSAYAREIWELLRYLPYHVRYSLYGEWRDVIASTTNARTMSAMTLGAYEAERTTKTAMRKLTKTDFKSSGRILAKVAQSNPCAMWRVIMDQVKAYAITGQVVPEAMRYMPPIAYDVITFAVLDEMASPPKTQAQAEAKTGHVQNLSRFLGEACRRHVLIELEPVIQFIVNRLQTRSPGDLVVLGTLITIMSGDEPLGNSSISDAQFAALAGGPELVREGLYETREAFTKPMFVEASIAVRDAGAQTKAAAPTKRSLKRLVDALRATHLAVPVWIALAQARKGSLAQMEDYPAKAMAKGFDDAHDVFLQYSSLLTDQFTEEEHIQLMPPLDILVKEFHIDEPVAFHMLRGKLTAEMKKAHRIEGDALQRRLDAEKAEAERVKDQPDSAGTSEESAVEAETAVAKRKRQWWPTALHEVMLQSKEILPYDAVRNQTVLPCPFYAFFWQMSLMDLEVPIASYESAITRLKKTADEIRTWKALPNGRFPRQADIIKEAKRFDDRIAELSKERETQMSNVSGLYRKTLRQRSAKWFEGYGTMLPDQRRLSRELYQRCFFPRAIMSPADSAYVAKMIARLHEYGCQGFSVLYAYDHFFSEQLAAAIYTCTDDEARNFGRCLSVILGDLNKWHYDERLFNECALGIGKSRDKPTEPTLPGFHVRKNRGADGSDSITHMSWNDFRRWMLKVHKNLAQALVSCLNRGDYRHVFNGITVAQKVLEQFPLEEHHGKDVLQALQAYTGTRLQADGTLKATEEGSNAREDIQNLANSYQSQLTQKRKARPWLSQAAFCPPAAGTPAAKAQAAAAATAATAPAAAPATTASADTHEGKPAAAEPMDVDPPAGSATSTNGRTEVATAIPTGPSATRGLRSSSNRPPASPAHEAVAVTPEAAALRARIAESRGRPVDETTIAANGASGRSTPIAPSGPRRAVPPHLENGALATTNGNAQLSAANTQAGDTEVTEDEKLAHQRILDARARKFQSNSASGTPAHSRDVTPPASRPSSRRDGPDLGPPRPSRRRSASVESRASERSRRDPRDDKGRPRDDRDRSRRDDRRESREERDRDRDGRRSDASRESSRRNGTETESERHRQSRLVNAHEADVGPHHGDRIVEPPFGHAEGGRSKRSESGRDKERDDRRDRDRERPRESDRPERESRRDRDRRSGDDKRRKDEEGRERTRESTRDKDSSRESGRRSGEAREHRGRRDEMERTKARDGQGSSRELLPSGPASDQRSTTARDRTTFAPEDAGIARPAAASAPPVRQVQAMSPHGLPPKPISSSQVGHIQTHAERMAPMAPPPLPSGPARSSFPMRTNSPASGRPGSPAVRAENTASPRPDKRTIEDVAMPEEAPEAKKGPAVKIDRLRGKGSKPPSSLMSAMTSAVRSVNDQKSGGA